jgi:hypothetical protein
VIVGGKEGATKGTFKFPTTEERDKFVAAQAEVGKLVDELKDAKKALDSVMAA